jgi:hypothetical protein
MQSTETKKAKTISGLLASALDMEDEIAHSVYRDYMERKNWPVELKDETFEEIRKNLSILLEDTKRHRNIIKNLQSKLGRDDG